MEVAAAFNQEIVELRQKNPEEARQVRYSWG
jgi:hypothetical protein